MGSCTGFFNGPGSVEGECVGVTEGCGADFDEDVFSVWFGDGDCVDGVWFVNLWSDQQGG